MCLTKINAINPTLHYTSESLRINIAAVLLQSSLHLANSHCPTYASCGLDGRCQALCDTAHCECQCKASRIRIYEAQPSNVGCTLDHPTSALLRSLISFSQPFLSVLLLLSLRELFVPRVLPSPVFSSKWVSSRVLSARVLSSPGLFFPYLCWGRSCL